MTAIAESKLAVETVVTIRDRAVEAYQELLRMPV
jgi:flagellar hook-basal body complex protein FliE